MLLHVDGFVFEFSAADLQEHEDTTQSPLYIEYTSLILLVYTSASYRNVHIYLSSLL